MMDSSTALCDFLLMAMYKHSKLFMLAYKKEMEGAQVFSELDTPYNVLWEIMQNTYGVLRKIPSVSMLAAEFSQYCAQNRDIPIERIKYALDFCKRARGFTAEDVKYEEGLVYLETALKNNMNQKWLDKLNAMPPDVDEIHGALSSIKADIRTINVRRKQVFDRPLLNPERYLIADERIPLGISFWDDISFGGGRLGDIWGVLGPTGGGKTTLAVQLACAQAIAQRHVAYLTFEQRVPGDIFQRMCSRFTGLPRRVFKDKTYDTLDERTRVMLKDSFLRFSEFLMVKDFSGITKSKEAVEGEAPSEEMDPSPDFGTAEDICTMLDDEFEATGIRPKMLIIDWLEPMVRRIAAKTGRDLDKAFRFLADSEIDIIRAYCIKHNIMCFIFHQLSTEFCSKAKAATRPKDTDAKNYKSFAHLLDANFCLGVRDKNNGNVGLFLSSKNRKDAPGEVLTRLDGENAKIFRALNYIPDGSGSFQDPTAPLPDMGDLNGTTSEMFGGGA